MDLCIFNVSKEYLLVLGIFLDTETNGLNPFKHRLLEIAYTLVDLFSGEVFYTFQAVLSIPKEAWDQSDKESLKVNGFTWKEISLGNPPSAVAQEILTTFKQFPIKRGNAVFICQNPSFDRAFFSQLIDTEVQETLLWPYHWLDLASMYWAEAIRCGKEHPDRYPWNTGVSKDKISTARNIPPEEKPHRALNGVNHLMLCYESIVGFPGRGK